MEKWPKLVGIEIAQRNDFNPLLKAIFVDEKANIIEVTLLSQQPWCFEIVRNGTLRYGAWYPEHVACEKVLFRLLQWVAGKKGV